MRTSTSTQASRLIRTLREQAGLTQRQLAELIGTTQSVISRLESDDYEGHSLSMLVRIGAALDRRIAVTSVDEGAVALAVHEDAPNYEVGGAPSEFDRLADRIAERFAHRGITRADVREAIAWARGEAPGRSVAELRGAIAVGPGNVVEDVRRARARRGEQEQWVERE